MRSLDHGKTWEDISDIVSFPSGIRHGTAFAVESSEVERLLGLSYSNPIIPDYIADPSVSKFGDTYYLYGTTDIDQALSQAGTPVVWKSKDFVNWSFEGTHLPGIPWKRSYDNGKGGRGYHRYWAPGRVIERDSLYWLYVTIVEPNDEQGMYLLKSEKPEGPFSFVSAEAIEHDIDGEVLVDDDGTPYFFWRRRKVSQMTPEWDKLVGETVELKTNRGGYSEGPTAFKRNGIYYYIYTLSGHQNYVNAYMMSKEGPISGYETPKGNDIFIFSNLGTDVWGPGHGNVFYDEDRDEYFFVYLEYGDGGTTRRVYANRMEFNPDGTIKTMVPDRFGVGALAPLTETRPDLARHAKARATSVKQPRKTKVDIETQPNKPAAGTKVSMTRQSTYAAANAIDGWNGACWQANDEDEAPALTLDFGKITELTEARMYFTIPTEGHTWRLETSIDGKNWELASEQSEKAIRSPHVANIGLSARYLRLSITSGSAGLWQINVF